jgi:hypothetical protein
MNDKFSEWQERNLQSLATVNAEDNRRAAWHASAAATLEAVHSMLDHAGVLRHNAIGEEYSVGERICNLAACREFVEEFARNGCHHACTTASCSHAGKVRIQRARGIVAA